jgi:hypothetical protein
MSDAGLLAALEKTVFFMEPYDREYPNITFAKAVGMENAALEREAAAFVRPQWITRTIEIKLTHGRSMFVTAEILGNLAVHPMWLSKQYDFSKSRYTLAHLPTTRAFQSSLGLTGAKYLAEKLVHLDWDFEGITMPLETREKAWVIVQAFRLNTKARRAK